MSCQAVSLEVIDIAKPCPADWDAMRGDERVRFCKHCSLHVYNLSAMSRPAAEKLVAETEGRLCVRFYRRADGTVITQDCGGGWRLAAKKLGRWASAATAVMLAAALAPLGLSRWLSASATDQQTPPKCVDPRAELGDVVDPHLQLMGRIKPPTSQPVIMGEIAPAPLMGTPIALPPATQPTTQPAK